MTAKLLQVENLITAFQTDAGLLTAVDGVSFSVEHGKTLGIVGESGCGKSVSAFSINRLLPQPHGRILGGRVLFEGRDLVSMSDVELRKVRGREIGMIFQEPMTALNPVQRIGKQLIEAILTHEKMPAAAARARVISMLERVRIPAPETRIDEYPHQLSGGMRQRVMIAMALMHKPKLLIADEPTTALDVTVQAQILDLISGLQKEMGMAVILITHDLGVIAETCDEVAVMYAGRIVERAPVHELFANPRHAYTRGLLDSIPRLDSTPKTKLKVISGSVPGIADFKEGCRFAERSGNEHSSHDLNTRAAFTEITPEHWVEACPVCTEFEIANEKPIQYNTIHERHATTMGRNRSGDSPWSFGDAKSYLGRSSRTGGTEQGDHGRASQRSEQLQCLVSYAKSKRCLIPADRYFGPIDQGAEHRVFFEAARSRAIKITNANQCGMTYLHGEPVAALPEEYLQRWIQHNQIFGDDVELDGVMESPSGISLVVSQKWIVGEASSLERIAQYMAMLGFAPTHSVYDYYRASDNLAVLDCHEVNVMLGINGRMYAIDVIPVNADEALKKVLGVS